MSTMMGRMGGFETTGALTKPPPTYGHLPIPGTIIPQVEGNA